jgi:dihydroxyacetone kinase
MLQQARDAVGEQVEYLGELDAVAGDGDHGIGMLRGLNAAVDAAGAMEEGIGVRDLLERAGDAWSETAGGTSGALWGAALAELGQALGDRDRYTSADVAAAAAAACRRVGEVGGAKPGDKTMLDAMGPFHESLTAGVTAGEELAAALAAAASAAREGADATSAMTPRLGRARPLAERSVGHPDPGATSFWIIADAVAQAAGAGREVE